MLSRFFNLALIFAVAMSWAGAMVGPTGGTLGSFTAATTNSAGVLIDDPLPAPIVTSITPSNTATHVPKLSMVIVAFSEAMNPTSTAQAFALQQVSGGSCSLAAPCTVPGTIKWPMPGMLQFIPGAPLATPLIDYRVSISTLAQASAGNGSIRLAAPVTSTFTTGDGTEAVPPPTVVLSAPTGVVQPKTAIEITFSEQMDPVSAEAAFSLQQTSGSRGGTACSVSAPCAIPVSPKAFSWGGPAGNILTYAPAPDLAPANYRVTVQTTAKSLYGASLDPGGPPPTNVFTFAVSGAPLGPPDAPVIVSPAGVTWVSTTTFTISGITKQPNLLIQALNGDGHVVASIQLDGGSTSFALPVPVAEGSNVFTIVASNAFYNSVGNPRVTLQRDDRATTLDAWSVVPDFDQIEIKIPYHGDVDGGSYATFTCSQAAAPCSGSPTAKLTGANGLFSFTFTGLKVSTTYSVQADVFDADPVTCVSPWIPVSTTHCMQTVTVTTSPQTPTGGSISALTVVPNDGADAGKSQDGLLASAAPQKQVFKLTYNCGAACVTASSVLLVIDDQSAKRVNAVCSQPAAPNAAHVATATLTWDGKDRGGSLVADGVYPYTLKVFDDDACGATATAHYVAVHSGNVIKVSNAGSLSVSSPATSLTGGSSVEIDARLQNYGGTNVADGDAAIDPASGAAVTLTAVGAITNSGLSFSGGSVVNGIPQVTALVGEAGQGCAAAGRLGQACAQLNVASTAVVAQYITITATTGSQGARSAVVGQLALPNPPLPPSNVTVSPGSINVSWTASPTTNVTGYRILLGRAPGQYERMIDAGNVTSYHIADVDPGTTYYVTVQSYTAEGLLSLIRPSDEVSIASATATPTVTHTPTRTPTVTVTPTLTPTVTGTPGPCGAPTATPTAATAGTETPTPVDTPPPTPTPTATCTPVPTPSATLTATTTPSPAASASATLSVTATPTASAPASTPTGSATPATPAAGPSVTSTPGATALPTFTLTATPTNTATRTPTATRTAAPTATRTP